MPARHCHRLRPPERDQIRREYAVLLRDALGSRPAAGTVLDLCRRWGIARGSLHEIIRGRKGKPAPPLEIPPAEPLGPGRAAAWPFGDCLTCHSGVAVRRGCCLGCYRRHKNRIRMGRVTWEQLEREGKCRPPTAAEWSRGRVRFGLAGGG